MRTSRIRQALSATHSDRRKSSAEAKTSACRPEQRSSRRVDLRTEASSSTMETSGAPGAGSLHPLLSVDQTLFMLHDSLAQHRNSTVPWNRSGTVLWDRDRLRIRSSRREEALNEGRQNEVRASLPRLLRVSIGNSELLRHTNQIGER